MFNQPIKLTRTKYTYSTGNYSLYNYRASDSKLKDDRGYSLITEDATLLAFSTEAEEGSQSVVGIVKLETGAVITVALSSIIFC